MDFNFYDCLEAENLSVFELKKNCSFHSTAVKFDGNFSTKTLEKHLCFISTRPYRIDFLS